MIKGGEMSGFHSNNFLEVKMNTNIQFFRFILFFLAFVVVTGCNTPSSGPATPSDVVKTYFSALAKGDQQTLAEIKLDGEGVAPIAVGAARGLAADRGKLTCSHTIKGNVAVVKATFENGEVINVILENVDGKWKLDRMANEQLVPATSFLPDEFKEEKGEDEKEE
jgi:hypothetical protein